MQLDFNKEIRSSNVLGLLSESHLLLEASWIMLVQDYIAKVKLKTIRLD